MIESFISKGKNMQKYTFIKNNIFLLLFLFLFTGCSQIVNVLLAPVTIPVSLLLNATKKEPYYNPNYIVTEECSREILQTITIETGLSFNEYQSVVINGMISEIIHTKTKPNDSVSIGVNTGQEDNNIYLTLKDDKTEEKFFYLISSSNNHLDLVLSGHIAEDYIASSAYMDTYRGHNIHALKHCSIP